MPKQVSFTELLELPTGTVFSPLKVYSRRIVRPEIWVLKGFVHNNPAPVSIGLDPRGFLYAKACDFHYDKELCGGGVKTWYPSTVRDAQFQVYEEAEVRLMVKTLSLPPIRVPYLPYLSDRADGVKGSYAIARWHPSGYREVWNTKLNDWSAFCSEVLSHEEALAVLKRIKLTVA